MTSKIYKTAMGKSVDLGALILDNENVRAVGNMNVNARGDILDSANRVIETKNAQVQRRYNQQGKPTNVTQNSVTSSTREAKLQKSVDDDVVAEPAPVELPSTTPEQESSSGLAGAIARSRAIKQEQLRTTKQIAQSQDGVKKI